MYENQNKAVPTPPQPKVGYGYRPKVYASRETSAAYPTDAGLAQERHAIQEVMSDPQPMNAPIVGDQKGEVSSRLESFGSVFEEQYNIMCMVVQNLTSIYHSAKRLGSDAQPDSVLMERLSMFEQEIMNYREAMHNNASVPVCISRTAAVTDIFSGVLAALNMDTATLANMLREQV